MFFLQAYEVYGFSKQLEVYNLKNDLKSGYKYTQEEKWDLARTTLGKIKDSPVAVRDYILFYLGKVYLKENQCDTARGLFLELWQKYPKSRWAPYAKLQVDSPSPCPPLMTPPVKELVPDCDLMKSLGKRADCLLSIRHHQEAKQLFLQLVQQRAGTPKEIDTLIGLSQAAARSQDFKTALEANEQIYRKFPTRREARKALEKIALIHQDAGNYAAAIPVWEELLSRPSPPKRQRSYWKELGWCHWRLGQYREALNYFESILEVREIPFGLYWKGRSLERLGEKTAAWEVYYSLIEQHPRHYYSYRALQRLHGKVPSALLQEWFERVPLRWQSEVVEIDSIEPIQRIEELLLLHFWQDAEVEIRRARFFHHLPLFSRGENLHRQGDTLLMEFSSPIQQDPDYPLPFAHFTFPLIHSSKGRLDPLLLYAMMRQESRFRDILVSRAGARGRMQILPLTGQTIARESGWAEFDPDWLFEPLTNLEVAVLYLKKLLRRFSGNWVLVVASYSAGEGQVESWWQARHELTEEEFIEEIPYEETREYVKKVYANWQAYRWIYR